MEILNIHTLDLYPDAGLIEGFIQSNGNDFYAVLNPASNEILYYESALEDIEDGENIDIPISDEEESIIKIVLMSLDIIG